MKVFPVVVALFASGFALTSFGATDEVKLDFAKINSNITKAMGPIVNESKQFKTLTYQFEPTMTNVDQDQFGVRITGAGLAPWSKEGFSTNALITFERNQDQAGTIKLHVEKSVKTDVLAFIRAAAGKSMACDLAPRLSGAMRIAEAQDCKVMPRLSKVASFDELATILQDHIKDHIAGLSAYNDALQAAHGMVAIAEVQDAFMDQARIVNTQLAALREAKIEREGDGLAVEMKGFQLCGLLEINGVKADLQPKELRVIGDLQTQVGSRIYRLAKPELVEVLGSIERGEEFGQRLVQLETKTWLRALEAKLTRLGGESVAF